MKSTANMSKRLTKSPNLCFRHLPSRNEMNDNASNNLVISAAFYHPEPLVRDRLQQSLQEWVAYLDPVYSDDDIREIIAGEKGTPLEPFVLDDTDFEAAVFLGKAAFSKNIGAKRFRIVSRETIGSKGGLVITSNLRSFYAERYAKGKYRRNPIAGATFVPALVPSSAENDLVRLNATSAVATADEKGFIIRLPIPPELVSLSLLARSFQKNGKLVPSDTPLDDAGLRVDAGSSAIEIRTGSPEAQIKLAAHMMNREKVFLTTGSDFPRMPEAYIVLEMPEDDRKQLKTFFVQSDQHSPWIRLDTSLPITINNRDKLAISKWLPAHDSWIDEIWDELP